MSERSTRAISSVLSVSFIHHFILRAFHYFARFSCHVSLRTRRRIRRDPVTAFRSTREQGWLSLARVAFNQNVRVALYSPLHSLGHTWNQYCWKRETDSGVQPVGSLGAAKSITWLVSRPRVQSIHHASKIPNMRSLSIVQSVLSTTSFSLPLLDK